MKCDLCNNACNPTAAEPAWTYRTVNTVTGPNDPSLPAGMGIWAEDEEWLVCERCHGIIQTGDRVALAARSIMEQAKAMGRMAEHHRAEIVRIHRLFWAALSTQPPVPEPGHRA